MKEVWDKERPKELGKPQKLSPMQKAAAKAMAKKAGRPTRLKLALKAWGFGSKEAARNFANRHKKD